MSMRHKCPKKLKTAPVYVTTKISLHHREYRVWKRRETVRKTEQAGEKIERQKQREKHSRVGGIL